MKRPFVLSLLSVGALSGVLCAIVQNAFAQGPASAETPQTGVVLTKLSPPVYPPLARQARIMGDVKVYVHLRKDGTVESTELFSGHPLLAPAAMESAKRSQFDCHGCAGVTAYSLTYTFVIGDECHNSPDCSTLEERPPVIQRSLSHVVITVDPRCTCDPAVSITRIKWRSPKCLYLWHCDSRVIDAH